MLHFTIFTTVLRFTIHTYIVVLSWTEATMFCNYLKNYFNPNLNINLSIFCIFVAAYFLEQNPPGKRVRVTFYTSCM